MRRLGLDLDGVVCDTFVAVRDMAWARYRVRMDYESITQYGVEYCTGLTAAQAEELFNHPHLYLRVPPMPDGPQTVRKLAKSWALHILTSRPDRTAVVVATRVWLRHYAIPYDQLLFLPAEKKPVVAVRLGLSVVVEDRLDTALALAQSGVHVLLFNQPWNQASDLPPNVVRCHDWGQVLWELEEYHESGPVS